MCEESGGEIKPLNQIEEHPATAELLKQAHDYLAARKAVLLTVSGAYNMVLRMTAHIYGRGQMVIPSKARKEAGINTGDVVLVEPNGDGRILLIRLEKPKARKSSNARLVRRKGKHPVIAGAPKVSTYQINRILHDEFP